MKLSDLFKRKSKVGKPNVETQVSASIDVYKNLLKKGEGITKADLQTIPDAELETVVMSWMWNQFNPDWSNQYDVIRALPIPCQSVYSCRAVSDEVNNGGFKQLFFNTAAQFADMAVSGFIQLGPETLSNIVKEAIVLFQEHRSTLEAYQDGTVERFSASCDETIFDDLDRQFYAECDAVDYEGYIKRNLADFGN